jgi:hypothetical protein
MNFDVLGTTRRKRAGKLLLGGSVVALMLGTHPVMAQNAGTTGTDAPPAHHVHPTHHHHRIAAAKTTTPETGVKQPETGVKQPGTAGKSTGASNDTSSPSAANPTGTGAAAKTEPPPATNSAPANTAGHNEVSGTTNPSGNPATGATGGTAENKANPTVAATPPPPPPPLKAPLDAAVAETFVGQPVYGSKGEKIGDLSKLETGPDGKVKSAVITWGGLFGLFQSSQTIDWAHADPVVKDGKLVLNAMTKEQVRNNEKSQASR